MDQFGKYSKDDSELLPADKSKSFCGFEILVSLFPQEFKSELSESTLAFAAKPEIEISKSPDAAHTA